MGFAVTRRVDAVILCTTGNGGAPVGRSFGAQPLAVEYQPKLAAGDQTARIRSPRILAEALHPSGPDTSTRIDDCTCAAAFGEEHKPDSEAIVAAQVRSPAELVGPSAAEDIAIIPARREGEPDGGTARAAITEHPPNRACLQANRRLTPARSAVVGTTRRSDG